MAEGLYALDPEGRVTLINASAATMLGYEEGELLGLLAHEVIHLTEGDRAPASERDCPLFDVRHHGTVRREVETSFRRKDGTSFPVAYSAAPLREYLGGSGVVVVFRDITEEEAERDRMRRELDELTWVGRIRDALDEERFVLYAQPIFAVRSGEKLCDELLLRMVGRNDEVIPPGAFLPAAEKYGLIGEIDRRVIRKAITLAAEGRRVEANLSADSISDPRLLGYIESQLAESGADPADVVFELTETAVMKDVRVGESFARGLERLGCGLALDDFGTGFGSFSYLKLLPIRYLKVDLEFVKDLSTNTSNRHIVKAIVGLARDFGYETIAEGVEDEETLRLLAEFGVDSAQGFHLGRPAPIDASP